MKASFSSLYCAINSSLSIFSSGVNIISSIKTFALRANKRANFYLPFNKLITNHIVKQFTLHTVDLDLD